MNKYLEAIYRHDEYSLGLYLENCSDNAFLEINEALRVVLGDEQFDQEKRFRYAEMLLLGGADPNTSDWDRGPLISQAIQRQDLCMVQLLLNYACALNVRSDEGRTPVHEAAALGNAALLGLLLASGAPSNMADEEGETPLMTAVRTGDEESIGLMLIQANVKAANAWQNTALHLAVCAENARAVELLIEANAPLNASNSHGNTALSMAVGLENTDLVQLLLSAGADVNKGTYDNAGVSPLHVAASFGRCDLIQTLIQKGAKINFACNETGRTPLYEAIKRRHLHATRTLLQLNASPNSMFALSNGDKISPVDVAIDIKDYAMIKMLLLAGALFKQDTLGSITALLFSDMILQNQNWNSPGEKLLEKETLKKITSIPSSLKQLARVSVRNRIGVCTIDKVNLLHLPPALQDFVCLKELDDLPL